VIALMRRTLLVSVVLAMALLAPATSVAAPTVTWHRKQAFSVTGTATDRDGHVYVTGFAPRGPQQYFGQPYVMVLAKFNADGTRAWAQTWRSRNETFPHAMAFDVSVSPDGRDVYVVGGVLVDSAEGGVARIWAYTATGRLRWSRTTPTVGWWLSASATDAGLVTGARSIAAWTRAGDQRWVRPFLDLTGDVCFVSMDVDVGAGGQIYAVGFLDRDPTCNDVEGGDLQDADITIQRRDANGSVRWTRVLDDPRERDIDLASAVSTSRSGVFVAGVDDGRAWLGRSTVRGKLTWTRHWGNRARGIDVVVAPWGPVYALSRTRGTIVLRSFTTAEGDPIDRWLQAEPGHPSLPGAVAAARGRTLYVAASRSLDRGDLWQLRA
jgi:hypothetical protein